VPEVATTSVLDAMSGPQKAAVLLVQLGKERAAPLLRCLREDEIEAVMTEVALLQHVDAAVVDAVLQEFKELATAKMYVSQGGAVYARELLEASVGAVKANEILDRLNTVMVELPFEFMRRADARQVLSYLQDEHPQTIALVLAHMPPEQAAAVLSGLPEALQGDVAARIATMDRTDPEVVRQVEAVLQRKLSSFIQSSELSAVGGVQPLVDILNYSDRTTEKVILEGLERGNPELAETVRGQMFVFEDISQLDDRSVQLLLREVDNKELAVALKGVRDDVRQKIMGNMSERAAANLADEIDVLGPVRAKTVGEAQGNVVRVIRTLEESGQITISRGGGGDDLIV
jgi:flagellar motor switch protein FliG